ncbi:MAG TPA: heavy metal-binding domain-containing protein [Streptosporangiaceae bacterium]|nr:heavy metal-binding domain-containing protein [Streptosporangiaceae bacterium]
MSQDLPDTARARLAEIKASGTWGSALSTAEFAAIRSVGFVPAGQVFGAAVFSIKNAGTYDCPTYAGAIRPASSIQTGRPTVRTAGSSHSSSGNTFWPLVRAHYQARQVAIDRMVAECVALDGHGVVGVQFDVEPFPAGGLEVRALGTAIKAPAGPSLQRPFTCERSGQEFAKLMLAGWAPVAIVVGISVGVRHVDNWTSYQTSLAARGNAEVSAHSEVANQTRRDATEQLRLDVRKHHGSGVVTREMEMSFEDFECKGKREAKDQMAHATIMGTAITRFGRNQDRFGPMKSNLILSLGDRVLGDQARS